MVRQHRETRSKFIKVKCPDCENEQTIFDKASTKVECVVCGRLLAEPSGGKARIQVEQLAEFK